MPPAQLIHLNSADILLLHWFFHLSIIHSFSLIIYLQLFPQNVPFLVLEPTPLNSALQPLLEGILNYLKSFIHHPTFSVSLGEGEERKGWKKGRGEGRGREGIGKGGVTTTFWGKVTPLSRPKKFLIYLKRIQRNGIVW